MSFGFSVGDFIAVIELCYRIRKDFVAAPAQFEAISDELRITLVIFMALAQLTCQFQLD
jgi:hypothetical protein